MSDEDTERRTTGEHGSNQGPRLTLQRALELLDLKEVPGGPDYSGILIGGLESLLKSHGEAWIVQHREGLIEEMQAVADL
jgi:hypothetical protein